MTDHIYRVMPEVAPGVFRSRATGGSPGHEYRLGEWTERVTDVRLCGRGFHTLSPSGLLKYAQVGDSIVRCKRRGIGDFDYNKATNERVMPVEVVGIATERALRLTAADCAESVLHLYAARYPDDPTLEVVIHTVRAFAHGGATRDELDAARAAAAAGDAAWDAARAAAGQALLMHAAEEADHE